MRIALLTLGSRGDVQPLVVLADELARRGHDIALAVPPNLVELANRAGFDECYPLGPDSQAFVETEQGQKWLASGNVRKFLKAMGEAGHDMAPEADRQLLRVAEGADLIVCGVLGEDHALCVSEAWNIPLVSMHLVPIRPNRQYPNFLVTPHNLRWGAVNHLSGVAVEKTLWRILRSDTNELRAQLGLEPANTPTPERMAQRGTLELQCYSRHLMPTLDLGADRPFTGFLTPDDELRRRWGEHGVDPELDRWLDADAPPIYFGFGSMPVLDPQATFSMIERVSERLGQRALVSAGWSRMRASDAMTKDVFMTGALDHGAVLPRCRAAVHHGGAGTTAAVTLAGLPSLVCSVFADQPFYGERLTDLGIGAHCRFKKLDEERLHAGVAHLLDDEVARRAAAVGAQLRTEGRAVERAADLIDQKVG